MIIVPRFPHQFQRLQPVNPAEQLVKLGRHQELRRPGHWRSEAVADLGEVEHLVAECRHPAAQTTGQAARQEPEAAGEQAVQDRVLREVQRALASQSQLSPVSTWTAGDCSTNLSTLPWWAHSHQ